MGKGSTKGGRGGRGGGRGKGRGGKGGKGEIETKAALNAAITKAKKDQGQSFRVDRGEGVMKNKPDRVAEPRKRSTGGEKKRKPEGDKKPFVKKPRFVKKGGAKEVVKKKTGGTPGGAVGESISLWNSFREKTLEKSTRQAAIAKAIAALGGRLFEASLKHDAARVVQACVRSGDASQRSTVFAELAPRIAELAKLPYARHVALCMLRYCPKGEAQETVFGAFKGTFAKLATHANGARVAQKLVESMPKNKAQLLRAELYGGEFTLLLQGPVAPDLAAILAANEPRRERVLEHLERTLQRLGEKSLVHHGYAQDLLREYTDHCGPARVRVLAGHLADASAQIANSRSGALGLASLVTFADVRTRKRVLKALKGTAADAAKHPNAYLALLRTMDVVDDTVASSKLAAELFEGEKGLTVALSPTGSKVMVWLARGLAKEAKGFDPLEHALLGPDSATLEVEKGSFASKKQREQRSAELLAKLSPKLVALCKRNSKKLLASRSGGKVLTAVLLATRDENLASAIAKAACSASFDEDEVEEKKKTAFFGQGDDSDSDDDLLTTKKQDGDDDDDDEMEEDLDDEDDEEKFAENLPEDDQDEEDEEDEEMEVEEEEDDEEDDEESGCAILDHDVAHATLKTLLQREAAEEEEEQEQGVLGDAVLQRIIESGHLEQWAVSNRGALVLEALLRSPKIAKTLGEALRPLAPKLKAELAKAEGESKKALLTRLLSSTEKKKPDSAGKKNNKKNKK